MILAEYPVVGTVPTEYGPCARVQDNLRRVLGEAQNKLVQAAAKVKVRTSLTLLRVVETSFCGVALFAMSTR